MYISGRSRNVLGSGYISGRDNSSTEGFQQAARGYTVRLLKLTYIYYKNNMEINESLKIYASIIIQVEF
jgi:hypothetical protein